MRFWHRVPLGAGVSAGKSKPWEAQSARAKARGAVGQGRAGTGVERGSRARESPSVSPQCSGAGWKPQAWGEGAASKKRVRGLTSGQGGAQPPKSAASSCGLPRTPPWAWRLKWCRGPGVVLTGHSLATLPLPLGPKKTGWEKLTMGHWNSEPAHLSWKVSKLGYCFRS